MTCCCYRPEIVDTHLTTDWLYLCPCELDTMAINAHISKAFYQQFEWDEAAYVATAYNWTPQVQMKGSPWCVFVVCTTIKIYNPLFWIFIVLTVHKPNVYGKRYSYAVHAFFLMFSQDTMSRLRPCPRYLGDNHGHCRVGKGKVGSGLCS